MKTLCYLLLFFVCFAGSWLRGATYYVRPDGNDTFPGTSPERAWKTAARVSDASFTPGDRILFHGGSTFAGPVKFDAEDRGTAEWPIEVGSFGTSDGAVATIAAGAGVGIDVCDVSGLRISKLRVIGDGPGENTASGIRLLATRPEGAANMVIDNVEVAGFGRDGISIGAWETNRGYRDVRLTRCLTHDNLRTGILTWGPWGEGIYAHQRVYIGHCEAFNMRGGSGITLSSVDGGVVERSLAHNNGEEFSGGAGIWAWDSNAIVLQYNESYGNRTIGVDGDGFDLDGGVTNSVMQYNYSHDNDAAGFLLAQYTGAPQAMRNIIIRYNISENDCRRNGYGAIHVWNGEWAERVRDVQIYQNTTYLSSRLSGGQSAITVMTPTHSVAVCNNIFFASDGNCLVDVASGQVGISFRNNAYWSGGGDFRVRWCEQQYESLDAWLQAAGDQERLGARILAVHADPMLENPGKGGTLRHVNHLTKLTAYRLKPGSPLVRRGINLSDLGIQPGKHGFFGVPLSLTTPPAIGAHASPGMM
jgi:hypothetical protein